MPLAVNDQPTNRDSSDSSRSPSSSASDDRGRDADGDADADQRDRSTPGARRREVAARAWRASVAVARHYADGDAALGSGAMPETLQLLHYEYVSGHGGEACAASRGAPGA